MGERTRKRWIAAWAAIVLAAATPSYAETAKELRIGHQFGLGYLPFHVAREAGFFERRMRERGLEPVPVTLINSGGSPQMNDGLLSGNLEIGSGGYTAMMIFIDKTRGAGDQQFLGVAPLANVPYELFTTNPKIKGLKDLDAANDKIGLPAVKVSQPAVYLQMAAEQMYGQSKYAALDELTVTLSQPDGATSLLSGGGIVNGYLFAPPFNHQLLNKPGIAKVWSSHELFGTPATGISAWATVKFRRENPKLYAAVVDAMRDAMKLIDEDPRRAAEIYQKAENSKLPLDFITMVIGHPDLRYTMGPQGTTKIADFLHRTGRLKQNYPSWKDFFFPELHAEAGN